MPSHAAPEPASAGPPAEMTSNDVVDAIHRLQKEIVGLRKDKVGGIGDAFWGVGSGLVIGVPLIVFFVIVILTLVGMGLDSPLSNRLVSQPRVDDLGPMCL